MVREVSGRACYDQRDSTVACDQEAGLRHPEQQQNEMKEDLQGRHRGPAQPDGRSYGCADPWSCCGDRDRDHASIREPLRNGAQTLAVMATGDLTVRMQGEFRGDLRLIKESVSEAVSATASASNEISSSTEEMASEEQTSQAGEAANAVEEIKRMDQKGSTCRIVCNRRRMKSPKGCVRGKTKEVIRFREERFSG